MFGSILNPDFSIFESHIGKCGSGFNRANEITANALVRGGLNPENSPKALPSCQLEP